MDIPSYIRNKIRLAKALADARMAVYFRWEFTEIFIEQPYKWLWDEIKADSTVIDIGANIGDTTLYFAMNPNVKRVLSYEPNLILSKLAKEHFAMSPLNYKIDFAAKAITDDGKPRYLPKSIDGNDFLSYSTNGNGTKVSSVKLADVLQNQKNVVIKCDCEGAERFMFKDADLKEVYAMQIECHKNCDAEVISQLQSKGFNTAYTLRHSIDNSIIKVWREKGRKK